MSEEKSPKKRNTSIAFKKLEYDFPTKSISFDAILKSSLEVKDVWEIGEYETRITGSNIPLSEFAGHTLTRYFGVRQINAPLKKLTKAQAIAALAAGFSWEDAHTRRSAEKAPAPIVAVRAMNQMTPEEFREFMKQARAYEAELEGIEPETEESEESEEE